MSMTAYEEFIRRFEEVPGGEGAFGWLLFFGLRYISIDIGICVMGFCTGNLPTGQGPLPPEMKPTDRVVSTKAASTREPI